MQVIDQINGSALFAQSAYSAAVATKDNLGRDITSTYLTSHQSLDGYATQDWVSEQGYITGVDLGNYYTKNETSGAEELANAFSQIGPGGDEEVNSFVYDNSATINDVNSSYQTNSGNFLTALPEDLVYTADITGKLDASVYATDSAMLSAAIDYVSANVGDSITSPSGTILVNGSEIEATNYAINLTGVRTPYTTATTVNIALDTEFYPLNFGTINTGSFLNISGFGGNTGSFYIVGNDSANNVIILQFDNQSGSLGKIVSGIYAILDRGATGNYNFELSSYTLGSGVDELAWKNEINNLPTKEYLETNYQPQSAMTAYQPQNEMWRYLTTEDAFYTYQLKNDMSGYYTTADANTLSSMFSGAIDYISANAGGQEVSNVVQSNSGTWNDVKVYQSNSGTYLTSHQDLSDYQTIAGMTAYQPAGDYYSASNPSGFITGVDLTPYATTAEVDTLSSILSGAIDYVSAIAAGDEFPASANEAITAYQTNSGNYLTAISIPESATWNDVSTTVQTNSATWGQGGVPYSAGENIDIQDFVISSKDWSNDITDASANAYNETTAWVHDNYTNSADVSFLSAEVDKKLDGSAWEAVSGSLATEDYVILSDNLTYARATAFTTAQGYAKESACNSAFDYLNQNKLDVSAFDLPNSGNWNEATNVVETNSAAWFDNVGDAEVNSFVYTNSSTILDVDSTYQANSASYLTSHQDISYKLDTTAFSTVSGDFLTAAPSNMATTGDVAELAQTVSETYQVKGDYLTTADSANFYPMTGNPSSFATENWVTEQGYITGVDLSEYAKRDFVLSSIESATSGKLDVSSFASVSSDFLVAESLNGYATEQWVGEQGYLTEVSIPESANWNEATTTVQTNSSNWDNVTNKLDTTSFSDVSSTFLTAVDLTPYQTIEGMTAYQPVGDYATTAEIDSISSMLSGAIDYVSANAGDEFPVSADEAIQYVQTNSASLNEVSFTVNSNSASWGGGGGGASYTSPSSTIWMSADKIESTDSAYIPTHPEDVLLTATKSWSSTNGYNTLANTNKVYFVTDGRGSAFDNEGTFLNSSYNTTALAETEYPPIKLYTRTWVSVKFSAYSAGIMDAYVVELARKNEVNSSLNNKLDSSAFKGYYPSNNPSGFAKVSDVVMQSGVNLFDGRIIGINNQYLMGCDSAYNHTLVGTSAATGTKTASAYVGTGHQGINIQISARNNGTLYINWTAFSENGSNLSAGQLAFNSVQNRISGFEFNSPLAENISGVKLFGNNQNFTAYSAYTSDVKQLASQSNVTFLSGAVDYVSANAQPSLSSLNDAGVNNIIVTASLPATPDENTLYFIPET